MTEESLYKSPIRKLKIIKYTPSLKDELISFILSNELDEFKALHIFEKDLTKDNLEKKSNSLIDSNNLLFYILQNNEDNNVIGIFCLNILDQSNNISFIIKKNYRNKGYGKIGLYLLIKEISINNPNINEYHFTVSKNNISGILIIFGSNASNIKRNKYWVYFKNFEK